MPCWNELLFTNDQHKALLTNKTKNRISSGTWELDDMTGKKKKKGVKHDLWTSIYSWNTSCYLDDKRPQR